MSRDKAIFNLRTNWTEVDPVTKAGMLRSLNGHRIKLITIAQLIGRSVDEVRAAMKAVKSNMEAA